MVSWILQPDAYNTDCQSIIVMQSVISKVETYSDRRTRTCYGPIYKVINKCAQEQSPEEKKT